MEIYHIYIIDRPQKLADGELLYTALVNDDIINFSVLNNSPKRPKDLFFPFNKDDLFPRSRIKKLIKLSSLDENILFFVNRGKIYTQDTLPRDLYESTAARVVCNYSAFVNSYFPISFAKVLAANFFELNTTKSIVNTLPFIKDPDIRENLTYLISTK